MVLGEKLYAYIDFDASVVPGMPENILNWKYANLCKTLVRKDSKGVIMLDLHSQWLERLMGETYRKCLQRAKKFSAECETRYRTQGDTRLTGMYAALSEYLCHK